MSELQSIEGYLVCLTFKASKESVPSLLIHEGLELSHKQRNVNIQF